MFLFLAAWLVLLTLATLAPLRAGASCTPATHRARLAGGVVCLLLGALAARRFVSSFVLGSHPLDLDVVGGGASTLTLLTHGVLLLRRSALVGPGAWSLAAWTAGWAVIAAARALR